ncbi:MAG TPA: metallopeptidase TldD-related protein [Bryobacteraceae bacterium]|jgi:hypothetical protein|nr:metallopeptidase TldD-related protein [Bryobacteraceae bacterium]
MTRTSALALAISAALSVRALPAQERADKDVILRAMHDELQRSRALKIVDLDAPYFIEYSLEDADVFSVSATLGGIIHISRRPLRALDVNVRVGSPKFDNTNYVLSNFRAGGSGDVSPLPLDNNYLALRQTLWLSTDSTFKTAEEAISRKRSALQNVNVTDSLPDFSAAPVVHSWKPSARKPVNEEALQALTVKLSKIFLAYPKITSSEVDFESVQSDSYLANSEGTSIREPGGLAYFRVQANAQAADGMPVRNAVVFNALSASALPGEAAITREITALADNLTALAAAPQGEDYDGPVLFEPTATAQLFGQLLGDALKVSRKPVPQSGRPAPYQPSEFEGRAGARVLPEWMSVVDDPTQKSWRGIPLFGAYTYDDEGVKAERLPLVEEGVLKNFLLTRTPAFKGAESSNGRARLHGRFGASAAGFGNLFVEASKTESREALKQRLMELCKNRNKPYGLLIRKLDYPSSASLAELQRLFASSSRSAGGSRFVAPPLLVYRIYPDGREELVRGLRFRDVSTRSFKDILAASDHAEVFNFLDNAYPLALMGAGGYVSPAAVIAPAVLFEDMSLERSDDQLPKLPVVPPPDLRPER